MVYPRNCCYGVRPYPHFNRTAAYPVLDFFRDPPPGQISGEEWYLGELLCHILNGDVRALLGKGLDRKS